MINNSLSQPSSVKALSIRFQILLNYYYKCLSVIIHLLSSERKKWKTKHKGLCLSPAFTHIPCTVVQTVALLLMTLLVDRSQESMWTEYLSIWMISQMSLQTECYWRIGKRVNKPPNCYLPSLNLSTFKSTSIDENNWIVWRDQKHWNAHAYCQGWGQGGVK